MHHLPYQRILSQVGSLSQRSAGWAEGVIQHFDARVTQGNVLSSTPYSSPDGQTPSLGLSPTSAVSDGDVYKQAGMGQRVSSEAQKGHIAVTRLKTLKGDGVLANEVVANIIIIQNYETQQG